MRRGWLAPFRRADGRSLTRAFAALLFLNAFVIGLHGGFAAAPGAYAAAICHALPDGSGPAPAADHEHDCCLPGSASAPLPVPALAGRAPMPSARFALAPQGQFPPANGLLTGFGPRAPPAFPA